MLSLLLLFSALAENTPSTIKSCSSNNTIIEISEVKLSPNPIKKGEPLTVTMNGKAKKEIAADTMVDVTLKRNGLVVMRKSFDFCQEIKTVNLTCPIPAGALNLTQSFTVPQEVPSGQFNLHLVAKNKDAEVACVDADINI